jgi:MFS family permease
LVPGLRRKPIDCTSRRRSDGVLRMYTQIREGMPTTGNEASAEPAGRLKVGRNVYFLGLNSLVTDVSAEMVTAVLPLYLVFYLRMTTLQLGVVDGLYQGVTVLVRLLAGAAADRGGRHKELALSGYALSAVSKLGLLAAGGALVPLVGVITADRIGKGIRTAPRDALISLSAPAARLGTAFGLHRAMDTAGALLGPLVAFAILALVPGRFDVVFVVSFCIAGVGVAVLALLVEGRRGEMGEGSGAASLHAVLAVLRRPRFAVLVAAAFGLGLATIADAFVYLGLQRRAGFEPALLPLLPTGMAVSYLVLALPLGRLADRLGREHVLLAGYAMLAAVYLLLISPLQPVSLLMAVMLAFGAYYACTDGIMAALASASLPSGSRSVGLALVGTAAAVSRLFGSVVFGGLWSLAGLDPAVIVFLAGLLLAGGLVILGFRLTSRS